MFARISHYPSALIYIKIFIGASKVQLFSIPTKKKHDFCIYLRKIH